MNKNVRCLRGIPLNVCRSVNGGVFVAVFRAADAAQRALLAVSRAARMQLALGCGAVAVFAGSCVVFGVCGVFCPCAPRVFRLPFYRGVAAYPARVGLGAVCACGHGVGFCNAVSSAAFRAAKPMPVLVRVVVRVCKVVVVGKLAVFPAAAGAYGSVLAGSRAANVRRRNCKLRKRHFPGHCIIAENCTAAALVVRLCAVCGAGCVFLRNKLRRVNVVAFKHDLRFYYVYSRAEPCFLFIGVVLIFIVAAQ